MKWLCVSGLWRRWFMRPFNTLRHVDVKSFFHNFTDLFRSPFFKCLSHVLGSHFTSTMPHCPLDLVLLHFVHIHKLLENINAEYGQKALSLSVFVSNTEHKWALTINTVTSFSTCFHSSQLLYIILQNPPIYSSSVFHLPSSFHSSVPLFPSLLMRSEQGSGKLHVIRVQTYLCVCACVRMKERRGYKSPKSRSWASCGQVCDDVNLPVLFHFFSSLSLVPLWHQTSDLQSLQVKHQRC